MSAFSAALLLAAAGLLVPALVLFVEVLAALLPPRRRAPEQGRVRPRVAVLVPARDEAAGIEAQVAALARELAEGDRLLVIADRCQDDTAALARRAGAQVLERSSGPAGKGFALAAGALHLRAQPPEIVIVVDADTPPQPGLVARLAEAAAATGRPQQASYTLAPAAGAGFAGRLSAFAFRLRNGVRPRGLARLGLPCLLQGSGMAIPWTLLRDAPLAAARTAEDLALAVELALAGAPPLFCEAAAVTGVLPAQPDAALAQRRRWEHGHLALFFTHAPRLFAAAFARRDAALAGLALDLCVPPLSLLALLWLAAALPAVALATSGGVRAPAVALGLAATLVAVALGLAWLRFGRDLLPARAWLAAPGYVLAKLPVHAAFLRRREARWPAADRRR